MKNLKTKNSFLMIHVSFIIIMLLLCSFGIDNILKGTSAAFGNTSAVIGGMYKVIYYSNWPISEIKPESEKYNTNKTYSIASNMFEVPTGYEFSGWNTKSDGTGETYEVNESVQLTVSTPLELYAQWTEVIIEDEENILYGDVNQNNEIDEEDYLLIEKHLEKTIILEGQPLINADANEDGMVDLIDVDIIKQAYLGTKGYTDYLPNKPVPIYEIYKESTDGKVEEEPENPTEKDEDKDEENSSEKEELPGNGNSGIGNSGTGSGSSGNSSGNSGTSNGNSNSSGNNDANNKKPNKNEESNNDKKEEPEIVPEIPTPTIYNFKFMSGTIEYATTSCETTNKDKTCELTLPKESPIRQDYMFQGWSLKEDCTTDNLINYSIIVKSSNTYYACFSKIDNHLQQKTTSYVGIVVLVICAFSARIIYHLIHRFKKEQVNINN